MYLTLITLPLLGLIVYGFLGIGYKNVIITIRSILKLIHNKLTIYYIDLNIKYLHRAFFIFYVLLFSYLYSILGLSSLIIASLVCSYIIFIHKFVVKHDYNFNHKIGKLLLVITVINIIIPLVIICDTLVINWCTEIIRTSLLFFFNLIFAGHSLQDVDSEECRALLQAQWNKQTELVTENLNKSSKVLSAERIELVRSQERSYERLTEYKLHGKSRMVTIEQNKLISLELRKIANQIAATEKGKNQFNVTEIEEKVAAYLTKLIDNNKKN